VSDARSTDSREQAPGHPEILRIVAPNPGPMTHEGTNTYLHGSDPCTVIDPGPDDEGHLEAIRAAAGERGGIGLVLLTHSHQDHSEGAERLGVEVRIGGDGEVLGGLRTVATPGHAPDHVSYVTEDAVCFCGDIVLGEGSSWVAPEAGALAAYMESLRALAREDLSLICPGHGPWVTDPAAKLAEYLEHREARERRLLAALERGERSRRALRDEVWDDVPAELRPAAEHVMDAHLSKLRDEGRMPDGLVA
jgi:glyoxylase-like metal-dependent hydrolase (beta-lactamase superfamily II)